MAVPKTLIAIGKIVKAFGIKGEVVVLPLTNDVNRFAGLHRVFVGRDDTDVQEASIENAKPEVRGVRIRFADVEERTTAEKLIGSFLFVVAEDSARLPEGTFFIHDVVGLQVLDEGKRRIGVIREVLQLPAHDVYVIDADGREMLVPAVREFVRSIDVNAGTMVVHVIEGMGA